jgi:hypothetical protein
VPSRPPLTTRMQGLATRQRWEMHVQAHGEKVAHTLNIRDKLFVEVDLLANVYPAIHPRSMYYNV